MLDQGTAGGFVYGAQVGATGSSAPHQPAEPRLRWRLGIRAAVLVGFLSLLAGALLWWQVAANGPVVIPLTSVTPDAAGQQADNPPEQESSSPDSDGRDGSGPDEAGKPKEPGAASVVVHVAGAVKKAGVVRLPRGSRVHEGIAAAGGASPEADLDRLNLASTLEDGQKIYVPRRGEAAPPDSSGGPSAAGSAPTDGTGAGGTPGGMPGAGSTADAGTAGGGPGAKINLNKATAEQLAELPKVGPVLAQRIVDWRTQQGPFKSPEELDAVDGVGPKMLETLLPLVTV
ncbi:MAG TPA: ComEA family DNA-binding protein [Arthrobacter sp.]|nr:ComEA family DNA-binding protein [Arthrobacter sp.]